MTQKPSSDGALLVDVPACASHAPVDRSEESCDLARVPRRVQASRSRRLASAAALLLLGGCELVAGLTGSRARPEQRAGCTEALCGGAPEHVEPQPGGSALGGAAEAGLGAV